MGPGGPNYGPGDGSFGGGSNPNGLPGLNVIMPECPVGMSQEDCDARSLPILRWLDGYVTISNLIHKLGLNADQADWLTLNPTRAQEMYNYLNSSPLPVEQKNEIAKQHLDKMMSDIIYLTFIQTYAQNNPGLVMWWENDVWLSNPANFNLDIEEDYQFAELTLEEKILVISYPIQAYQINTNRAEAFAMSNTRMGNSGAHYGHDDKKDAFRHAYFQAINTRDVTPVLYPIPMSASTIVKLFSDAHESETPTQLDLEKQMDLFNNAVGIFYCWNCFTGTTSNDHIAIDIAQKLNNGDLRYLSPLNHSDPFWEIGPDGTKNTATDGLILPPNLLPNTQLIPTNQ